MENVDNLGGHKTFSRCYVSSEIDLERNHREIAAFFYGSGRERMRVAELCKEVNHPCRSSWACFLGIVVQGPEGKWVGEFGFSDDGVFGEFGVGWLGII